MRNTHTHTHTHTHTLFMRNHFVKYMRNMRDMEIKDSENLILELLYWFLLYVMGCVSL